MLIEDKQITIPFLSVGDHSVRLEYVCEALGHLSNAWGFGSTVEFHDSGLKAMFVEKGVTIAWGDGSYVRGPNYQLFYDEFHSIWKAWRENRGVIFLKTKLA